MMSRTLKQISIAWLENHLIQSYKTIFSLFAHPWQSLSLVLVISVAITLTSVAHLSQTHLHHYTQQQVAGSYIQIMLKDSISTNERSAIINSLKSISTVTNLDFISKQKAAKDFIEHTRLKNIDFTRHNPLPASIMAHIVADTSTHSTATIQTSLQKMSGVLEVIVNHNWNKNLRLWMDTLEKILLLLSAIIILGCIFVISNAVFLRMQQHLTEIHIIKIIGGTDAFICRPYIYIGCYLGIISGILAIIMIRLGWNMLLPTLSNLPIDSIPSNPLDTTDIVAIILYSAVICWLIAYFAAKIYLKRNA